MFRRDIVTPYVSLRHAAAFFVIARRYVYAAFFFALIRHYEAAFFAALRYATCSATVITFY